MYSGEKKETTCLQHTAFCPHLAEYGSLITALLVLGNPYCKVGHVNAAPPPQQEALHLLSAWVTKHPSSSFSKYRTVLILSQLC